jgi:hypothetical protein
MTIHTCCVTYLFGLDRGFASASDRKTRGASIAATVFATLVIQHGAC